MQTKLKFLRNFITRTFNSEIGEDKGKVIYQRPFDLNTDTNNDYILERYDYDLDTETGSTYRKRLVEVGPPLSITTLETKSILFSPIERKGYIFRDEPNIQLTKKNYQYVLDFVTWDDMYTNALPIFDLTDFDIMFYNSEIADYEISLSDTDAFDTDGTTIVFKSGSDPVAGVLNLVVTLTNINEPNLKLDIVFKITLEEEL